MEHATSSGGATTLQTVSIERGFWRATSTSTDVLACFRAEACLGGITGSSSYCRNGYEGPCEQSPGYFVTPRDTAYASLLYQEDGMHVASARLISNSPTEQQVISFKSIYSTIGNVCDELAYLFNIVM